MASEHKLPVLEVRSDVPSDLVLSDRATRLGFPAVVEQLREVLGARLVAYIAGVAETRAVHEWAEGDRTPKDPALAERLRLALRPALLIEESDGPGVAQAWFQGLNPLLDDRAPAQLLRESDLQQVGRDILAAARQFVVHG